ncbi:hypothetical protein [Bradyrhizobium valentinum]|nr:hypothetical protein [Bradyrhizobium valentinum]
MKKRLHGLRGLFFLSRQLRLAVELAAPRNQFSPFVLGQEHEIAHTFG